MSIYHTVEGLEFEAVRTMRPIPHWRLKLPNGEIWENGVGGLKGDTKNTLWDSLEYCARRLGKERFLREFS